jgi:hypothetical protein
VTPRLVADLASALKEPAPAAEKAVLRLLSALPSAPSVAELFELAARARARRATDEELGLAIATLLALHAPRAGRAALGS